MLERGGFLDEFGRDRVLADQGGSDRAIYRRLDAPVCTACTVRIFTECNVCAADGTPRSRVAARLQRPNGMLPMSIHCMPSCALELDGSDVNARRGMRSRTPIDGSRLARVPVPSVERMRRAQCAVRETGADALARRAGAAPRRAGAPFRRRVARAKDALGKLVTLETGKILQEGWAKCRR